MDLCEADLSGAILNGADLVGADLSGADLEGADLSGATNLTREQLAAAYGNVETKLPEGFAMPDTWPGRANAGDEGDRKISPASTDSQ